MYTSEELIRRIRPLIGHKADQIWASYLASDKQEQTLLNHALNQLHTRLVDDYRNEKIILPPPSQFYQLHGDYPIGLIHYADKPLYPFSLLQKELTQHIGVFGRTGAGKTYFVKGLLTSHILHHKKPAIIFDWKDTYTDLPHPTTIIKPGITPFRFNPLALDDIPQNQHKTYIRQIVELFIESFLEDLKLLTVQGVESLLILGVDTLLNQHPKITFHDLYQYIRTFKGKMREMDWKTTAENILYKLTTGPLGVVLENPSTTIESLTTSPIVFELSNIGNTKDKSFFIKSLLLRLYYHYQSKGTSSDLIQLIVLEEAHNILLRKPGGSESILERLFREIREFGVGLCVIDQHPSLISLPALGTYCTVAFNLSLAQDRVAMASALNLQHPHYLGKLHSRFAIVKIQDRYVEPFLIKTFPYQQTPSHSQSHSQSYTVGNPLSKRLQEVVRGIEQLQPPMDIESDVKHKNEVILMDKTGKDESGGLQEGIGFSGEFREVFRHNQVVTNDERIDKKQIREMNPENLHHQKSSDDKGVFRVFRPDHKNGNDTKKQKLNPIDGKAVPQEVFRVFRHMQKKRETPLTWEELLMCQIYAFPLMPAVERYTLLGLNKYQGHKYRTWLLTHNFITLQSVSTNTARIKLLVPTKQGFAWLKQRGFRAGPSDRLGGIEHRYWQRRLRDQFEREAYTVTVEKQIDGNNAVDLYVEKGTSAVGVEIETGTNSLKHMTSNIDKCRSQCIGVVSLVLDSNKRKRLHAISRYINVVVTGSEIECLQSVKKFLGDAR